MRSLYYGLARRSNMHAGRWPWLAGKVGQSFVAHISCIYPGWPFVAVPWYFEAAKEGYSFEPYTDQLGPYQSTLPPRCHRLALAKLEI
jgi:hypothetical protein